MCIAYYDDDNLMPSHFYLAKGQLIGETSFLVIEEGLRPFYARHTDTQKHKVSDSLRFNVLIQEYAKV